MTKKELLDRLEEVPEDAEILVNVKPLNDDEVQWHDIDIVSPELPVTLLISEEPVMK